MSDAEPDPASRPEPIAGAPHTRWQRAKLVLKVIEVRLRFIAILVATGLFIGYWDTIKNHWDKWTRPKAAQVAVVAADREFYCPMHPQVVRSGLDPNGAVPKCPICGMPLSLRKKGAAPKLPEGVTARVQLSPERIQLAGVRTEEVRYRPLSKEVVTVGHVQYDESRLSRIVTRVSGFIEKLHVKETYIQVAEGEPLAEIYSPELYSSAQGLLIAMRSGASVDLVAGARERLRLLGIAAAEIDEIEKSGKAAERLVIRSPRSGHVIQRAVLEGAHIEAGATLFDVADLSKVWVEADVFEKDISFMRRGAAVEATVEALPNRVFSGTIALVHPHLDPMTRTNTVRFVLENPGHELRPGMFATVRIAAPLEGPIAKDGQVLAVPERAVIDTGSRKVVYVEREAGLFEGVEVELASRIDEFYPVVKGLAAGDRVASAGAFLIDAETRLNPAAAATYVGAGGGPQSGRGSAPAAAAPREAEAAGLAGLSPEDQELARAQRLCPVDDYPLGSMGPPPKIMVNGEPVFLCCSACEAPVRKDPEATLKKVAALKGKEPRQP